MRLSFRVSVCAACFPVRYCPSRRFPLPVTRLIRKRPFFFFPPEHVLQRYFRALFANTWLPSDALPAYLSTIAPSPSAAPTRAFKRTCYRLPMRFCRSSKGLDRVAFFDASWSFQHPCGPCDGNGSVALLLAHRLRHSVKLIFPNVHLRTVFPMRAWL